MDCISWQGHQSRGELLETKHADTQYVASDRSFDDQSRGAMTKQWFLLAWYDVAALAPAQAALPRLPGGGFHLA